MGVVVVVLEGKKEGGGFDRKECSGRKEFSGLPYRNENVHNRSHSRGGIMETLQEVYSNGIPSCGLEIEKKIGQQGEVQTVGAQDAVAT